MTLPSYADLGKAARDLFNRDYHAGFVKINTNTRTFKDTNVEMKMNAQHNITNGKLIGGMDVKYTSAAHGLTLTEKWTTDNILSTTVDIKDQFAKGLKLTFESKYSPTTEKRSGDVKIEYIGNNVKVNCDAGLMGTPQVRMSFVTDVAGWLIGAQASADMISNKISKTGFSICKIGSDYVLHSFVNNGREFGASVFHQVASNVQIGGQLGWTSGEPTPRFGLAMMYRPSADLEFRGRVNNDAKVALSSIHYVSDRVKLIFSTQFGLSGSDLASQKFGLGMEYTA